jgi:hypothetical protein
MIVAFHLWNGITLQVGLFFIIGIATSVGIIPSVMIDKVKKPLATLKLIWLFLITSISNLLPLIELHVRLIKNITNHVLAIRSGNFLLTVLLIYVLAWNYSNLYFVPYVLDDPLKVPGFILRLDQNWGMFAPGVFKEDGWYVYQGTTVKGDTIDLNRNGNPINFSKPRSVVSTFKNDRWRKYGEQYYLPQNVLIRPFLCKYLMRKWNESHPQKKIRQLQILYLLEFTLPDDQVSRPESVELNDCY